MRLLVVDDEPLIRGILVGIVADLAECDQAENGQTAYESFEIALNTGRPYDVIFIDLAMPVMNGRKLLRAIRDKEMKLSVPEENRIKAVVISAENSPRQVAGSFFEDGCNDYIIKPFKVNEVLSILDKYKIVS
jgi:two-component system chemotaxis response regulator CheY